MGWGMPQESAKHKAERAEREAVKREVRARDRSCQAKTKVPEVRCSGRVEVHEIIPRSAWRKGYLVADNCLLVCRRHHDWIGDNPDAAHEAGLHGYSYEIPEEKRRW